MRKLLLKELLLTSRKEKAARRVSFHPETTVVRGGNDVGKSSLIKSIYRCFGAEPKTHEKWADANVKGLLSFCIDGNDFRILQDGDIYTLFDGSDTLIRKFTRVTTELAPCIANLLDFRLTLLSRQSEPITPPPAFLLLPFYIDQDISWQKNWASFRKLQQFSRWKKDVIEYHVGIKPNEFYATKGKVRACQEALKEPQQKYDMLKSLLANLDSRIKSVDFSVDLDDYHEELKQMLVLCEKLRQEEQEHKKKLVKAHNIKTSLEAQIGIATHALAEIRKDFSYATDQVAEDSIDCPICGASYDNNFAERFAIAKDEDRCQELLFDLQEELAAINKQIAQIDNIYGKTNAESEKIAALLEHKKGEIQLRDLIEGEGRKQVREILSEDATKVNQERQNLQEQIQDLKVKLKSLENKQRREEILRKYRFYMKSFLFELEVNNLSEKSYRRIDTPIKETGSDLPRALLAYYFSILAVMNKYSSTAQCPIIVDAPNQQDQDLSNLEKMLKFIAIRRPCDSQLILGLVDDCGVDFKGTEIVLDRKYCLLREEEYDEVMAEFRPLHDASMALDHDVP